MLDKVHRSDMVVLETVEETYDHGVVDVWFIGAFAYIIPHDHL